MKLKKAEKRRGCLPKQVSSAPIDKGITTNKTDGIIQLPIVSCHLSIFLQLMKFVLPSSRSIICNIGPPSVQHGRSVDSSPTSHPIPPRDLTEPGKLQYYWPLIGFPMTLDISLRRVQWRNWRHTPLTRDSEGLPAFQIQAEPSLIMAHATCTPNTRFYLKSAWNRER